MCVKVCVYDTSWLSEAHEAHEAHGSSGGGGHVHGGGGSVTLWRVAPAVWTPKALVTLHTAEAVTLRHLGHATLVQQSGPQLMVRASRPES